MLARTGNIAKFTAGNVRHLVDAGELVDGILEGAAAYFRFAARSARCGARRIGELRARAAALAFSPEASTPPNGRRQGVA